MLIMIYLLLFTVGGLLGILLATWVAKNKPEEPPAPAPQPKRRIPMDGTNVPIGSVAQTKFSISRGDGGSKNKSTKDKSAKH